MKTLLLLLLPLLSCKRECDWKKSTNHVVVGEDTLTFVTEHSECGYREYTSVEKVKSSMGENNKDGSFTITIIQDK